VVKGKYSRLKQSGIFNHVGMLGAIQSKNYGFNSIPSKATIYKGIYITHDVQNIFGKKRS
jgi:hypothetical protein